MGCADPPSKGVGAPHQCSRVNEQRSGWGESSLAGARSLLTTMTRNCRCHTGKAPRFALGKGVSTSVCGVADGCAFAE